MWRDKVHLNLLIRKLTKSQVVQAALCEYLVAVQSPTDANAAPKPDLLFLASDDPIRQFIGIAKGGMSMDELMHQLNLLLMDLCKPAVLFFTEPATAARIQQKFKSPH